MDITVLDGGMGQELVRRAGRATSLWSTQALLDAPDLVSEVHRDFFDAGADVATTNTYSVLPDRLLAHDLSTRMEELSETACTLAARARDAHGTGIVAGALGPLGFSYRPDLAPPAEEAAETYAMLCKLHEPHVDVHLAETMSSVEQARGALMGMAVTGKPIWIAFSVDDNDGTLLRSGEPLSDIADLIDRFNPERVLLNCARPEAIDHGLPTLGRMGRPFGAYGNGFAGIAKEFNKIGSTVDALEQRVEMTPSLYADFTDRWAELGATTLGGCCEIGPAHIAEIAARVTRRRSPGG